ncbi:MAG: RagB/SusD family nutrient uptake outer membrane protein [Bacteroidota bacterium]
MNKKFLIIAILLGLFHVSCDEELLDKVNPNELSSATFYADGAQATAAVNGVYASLQTIQLYTREYFFLHDLLSDENFGLGSLEAQRVQLIARSFDGANAIITQVWRGAHRGIHRANLVIDNVPETPLSADYTETQRTQHIAEARFLRAFYAFELVSLWGDVPFSQNVAGGEEAENGLPITSADQIYATIISDLDFAEQNLPNRSEYSSGELGRATRTAAQALKGRVQLFRGNYAEAAAELQKVVNSGEHRLMEEFTDNHTDENENNEEAIFEIQFSLAFGGGNRWSGDGNGIAEVTFRGQEYGMKAWRNVIPSEAIVNELLREEKAAGVEDPRAAFTIYRPGDLYNNGQDVVIAFETTPDDLPSWRKYQNYYDNLDEVNQQSGINFRSIRYADVLLMLAEAQNELGNQAEAVSLMNQVRARPSVDMPPLPTATFPAGSQAEVFEAIQHERIMELTSEQVRYRDILRWGIGSRVIPAWVSGKHELLPIPQQEIDANVAVTNADQNPGY